MNTEKILKKWVYYKDSHYWLKKDKELYNKLKMLFELAETTHINYLMEAGGFIIPVDYFNELADTVLSWTELLSNNNQHNSNRVALQTEDMQKIMIGANKFWGDIKNNWVWVKLPVKNKVKPKTNGVR